MRILMLATSAGPEGVHHAGRVVKVVKGEGSNEAVSEANAKAFVEGGYALRVPESADRYRAFKAQHLIITDRGGTKHRTGPWND